jgi:hypothetical protein
MDLLNSSRFRTWDCLSKSFIVQGVIKISICRKLPRIRILKACQHKVGFREPFKAWALMRPRIPAEVRKISSFVKTHPSFSGQHLGKRQRMMSKKIQIHIVHQLLANITETNLKS